MNTPIVTVPVGKTVRFNISSMDVIHSFYAPQFLYKLDAVPGRTQALWLKVTDPGFYQGQCAEFCGREHARMLFSVRALPLDEYEAWLAAITAPPAPADDAGDAAPEDGADDADDAADTDDAADADDADDSGDAGAARIGAGADAGPERVISAAGSLMQQTTVPREGTL